MLHSVGSTGDVLPFIGLGKTLKLRGFAPTLLANPHFEAPARAVGIDFVALGTKQEYERALTHPDLWHRGRGLKVIMEHLLPEPRQAFDRLQALSEPAGTLTIAHPFAFAARHLQEAANVPTVTLVLSTCLLRSRHRVPAIYGQQNLSRMHPLLQTLMWKLVDRYLIDPAVTARLAPLRRHLGLKKLHRPFHRWIFSPLLSIGLFPSWFCPPQPDWPDSLHLTGFPLFHGTEPLPAKTLDFLATRDRPIAFALGSGVTDAADFLDVARRSCARLGRPALFLGAFPEGASRSPGKEEHFVRFAPLDALLPACALLVHHGGIGTTGAALAGALPQIIRPVGFDHDDHAALVERLGVGRCLPPRKFTLNNLLPLLKELLDDEATAARCRIYAQKAHQDQAFTKACELIEKLP